MIDNLEHAFANGSAELAYSTTAVANLILKKLVRFLLILWDL